MKKLLYVIAISIFTLTTHAYSECRIRVGWEPWEPYQFKDSNGNFAGLDLEIVRAALEEAGCKVDFMRIAWQRLMASIEYGSMDAAMGASKSPEREKYAYFSTPYRNESYAFFVRKNDKNKHKITKLDDLVEKNLMFGIVTGYFYGEQFNEAMKNPKFKKLAEEVKDDKSNINKLHYGRIQGLFMDSYSGISQLENMNLSNEIVNSSFAIISGPIHAMFSKKSISPDIVKKFDDGLQKLKNSGRLDQIINKYLDGLGNHRNEKVQ